MVLFPTLASGAGQVSLYIKNKEENHFYFLLTRIEEAPLPIFDEEYIYIYIYVYIQRERERESPLCLFDIQNNDRAPLYSLYIENKNRTPLFSLE